MPVDVLCRCCDFFSLSLDGCVALERRGRPTSVVLLLLVVVAQLAFALSSHASLGLDDLLGLVGSARRLVSLASIEVLEVGLVSAAGVAKLSHGVRAGVHGAAVWRRGGQELAGEQTRQTMPWDAGIREQESQNGHQGPPGPQARSPSTRAERGSGKAPSPIASAQCRCKGRGRGAIPLTSARHSEHLATLHQVVHGAVHLCDAVSYPSLALPTAAASPIPCPEGPDVPSS